MKTATVTIQVQVSYDEASMTLAAVESALTERATAFLYQAGMSVESATVVAARRRASKR